MMNSELKFANELHYAEKGQLINIDASDEEINKIADSYFKRLWGNHERLVNCKDDFEKVWKERNGQ